MKKHPSLLLLSTLIFSITTLLSCSKINTMKTTNSINEVLSSSTQRAILAPTLTALKQSVSLLSTDERQSLWTIKLDAIVNNDKNKLTSDQMNIIETLRDFLKYKTIDGLIKNPVESEKFMNTNLAYFQKHFDNSQLYMLIECPYFEPEMSIFKSMDYLKKIDISISSVNYNSNVDDEDHDVWEDDFGGNSDPKCDCIYSVYCSFYYSRICKTSEIKCDRRGTECGVFGTTPCKGKCV